MEEVEIYLRMEKKEKKEEIKIIIKETDKKEMELLIARKKIRMYKQNKKDLVKLTEYLGKLENKKEGWKKEVKMIEKVKMKILSK